MFEKWFGGNNKKEVKPSVEGVAHFDEGVLEEEKFDQKLDDIQENFKDNKVSERSFNVRKRIIEDQGETFYESGTRGAEKNLTRQEKSRKPEHKDLHSDWKEKSVFDEPLSKQEMSDDHLDANEEINHGYEDGEHEEEEFTPGSVPETYEEWKGEDNDLEKAA